METLQGSDLIGHSDRNGRTVLYTASDGFSFILNRNGSFAIYKNLKGQSFQPFGIPTETFFIGDRVIHSSSLSGGGKIYQESKLPGHKRVYKLDRDHLGNLLLREAYSKSEFYRAKPSYRFGPPRLLLTKLELQLVKKQAKKFKKENRRMY